MALDTTVGGAAADSYVSLAEAATYFTNRNVPSASWSSKSDAEREAALRKATQYLDAYYSYAGQKVSETQALMWPRADVYFESFYVEETSIPRRIKDACCELALKAAAEDIMADVSAQVVTGESVGPLSVSYSENQRSGGRKQYDIADMLVSPFTKGRGMIPIVRT